MPPPEVRPHTSPERAAAQDRPEEAQPGELTDHTYEYGPYSQYGDGLPPADSATGASGYRPLAPPPPPPLPGRTPVSRLLAQARSAEVSGPGARSRRLDDIYEGQGTLTRGRPAERSQGPTGSKNLGALREVINYDPDREERGGVTVKDFLESVTGAASLGNLDGQDLMQVMPMRLQGSAKAFYRTFMDSKGLNPLSQGLGAHWDDFKKALADRFKQTTDSLATLMNLAGCRQGDKESVRAYAQRVTAMAIKLWPALLQSQDPTNQHLAKTLVYQHFQKGLRPHLLEFLNLKDIQDMDQAVRELARKETFDQTQKNRYGNQVNLVTSAPDEDLDKIRQQMSDLKTTVSAYMAETTELVRGQLAAVNAVYPEQYTPGHDLQADEAPGAVFTDDNYYQAVPEFHESNWDTQADGESYELVNAVGYQPRLPQYPILRPRPTMPAGQGQFGPRGGCNYCGGPHMWRQCPHLAYYHPRQHGVPYQGRMPWPGTFMGNPARPPRPTGAFPPRAMWQAPPPMGPTGPNRVPARQAYGQHKPALNGQHRL